MARTFVAALCATLTVACSTPIQQRCRLVTDQASPPPMPLGFVELDRILMQRVCAAGSVVRELRRRRTEIYRREFAGVLLPALCERLERARVEASSGFVREAGAHYQSLLVASQVLELYVALLQVAEYADGAGQPSGQILKIVDGERRKTAPPDDRSLRCRSATRGRPRGDTATTAIRSG